MGHSNRKRIAAIICLIIMGPLLLPALLAVIFEKAAEFINWLFEDRWITRTIVGTCDRVEKAFGVDAETEYKEWQARMKARRILSEKTYAD